MAEIFGAVASGAGLVSLSMQLLECTQKLKGFYDSCRDAPETVRQLCFDLETMSMALRQFEQYRQADIFGGELLGRCILACDQAVAKIKMAVDKVDRLLSRARFAGKLYMGFKEPEVRKLLEEMEHAKSSMLLAYTSYCQSWNMRQHMQQAAMAALHSERLSRLQDTLESGNSQLLGHVTALGHKDMEPSLLRPDLGQQHTRPKRPLYKGLKRKKIYEVRLSLPRWFSDSVWDFGMYASEGTWALCLQHKNMRPWETYTFKVVASGDIEAVRHLLQAGYLSFQDCAGEAASCANLLEIAATYGHVELCRFLLDNTSLFNDSAVLRSAFEAYLDPFFHYYLGLSPTERQDMSHVIEALYHLFAREHGMDEYPVYEFPDDIEHDGDSASIRNLSVNLKIESDVLTREGLSLTKSALQDVLAMQSLPFKTLPFSQRFEIAIELRGLPAESFLELLTGVDSARIVTSANVWGKQALHWAAEHFGASAIYSMCRNDAASYENMESYAALACQLILSGADVHAFAEVFPEGVLYDPFSYFLGGTRDPYSRAGWDHRSLSKAVWHWGEMLVSAGQSLVQYAATENQVLGSSEYHMGNFYKTRRRFRPTKLAVSEELGLAMYATTLVDVTRWSQKRTHVPGSWPNSYDPLPDTIIWTPEDEDDREGSCWRELETFTIESRPFLVEPTTSDPLATALFEARTELITGTQDDHGPVVLMVIRENSRQQRRTAYRARRAASMPRSLPTWRDISPTNQEGYAGDPLHSISVPLGKDESTSKCSLAHQCPFDGRWRICAKKFNVASWRRCMHGDHNHNPSSSFATYGYGCEHMTWESQLFESEDHVDIAERHSRRFYPEVMSVVEETRQRAKERDELKIAFPAMSFPPNQWSLADL